MISLINLSLKRQTKSQFNEHFTITTSNKNMQFLNFLPNFLLIGGHATSIYMPSRQTLDIDILIQNCDSQIVHDLFVKKKACFLTNLSIGGVSYKINNEIIDVLYSQDDWYQEAYKKAVFSYGVKVIPLEYLVLMKLKASRVQDLADCSRMLGLANKESIQQVRNTIKKYSYKDLEDLESLILLGKYECRQ